MPGVAGFLLIAQSLIALPVLVLATKGTVVALLVAVLAAAARRQRMWESSGVPVAAAMILLCGASALWAVDPTETLGKTLQFGGIVAVLLAMRGHVSAWSEVERETLTRWSLIGWGVAALLPAIDALAHAEIVAAISAITGIDPRETEILSRPSFVFKTCAVILTVTAFPVMAELLRRRRFGLAVVAVALLLVAILYTRSSSSLVAVVAGAAAWALHWLWPRLARRALAAGMVAVPVLMPLVPLLVDRFAVARAFPNFSTSFYQRLEIWQFTLERILEKPWLGWGFDAARTIPGGQEKFYASFPVPWMAELYETSTQYMPLHPHNGGLQIWLELGLAGAAMLAFVLARMVWSEVDDTRASAPMAGFFAAAAMPAIFAFGMAQSWWLAVLVMSWAALKAVPRGTRA